MIQIFQIITMLSALCCTSFYMNTTGLVPTAYYTFNSPTVIQRDTDYAIIDFSGNDFYATAENPYITDSYSDVSACEGEGFSGTFKLPSEMFEEVADFTFNFWMKSDSNVRRTPLFEFGDISVYPSWGSGSIRLCSYHENDTEIFSPEFSYYEDWNKLNMYTLMRKDGKMMMYFNGRLVSETIYDYESTLTLNDMFVNGEEFIVNAEFIDEFSFYDRALDSDRVATLFTEHNTRVNTDVITYNKNTNTVTSDMAGTLIICNFGENNTIGNTDVYKVDAGESVALTYEVTSGTKMFIWDGFNTIMPLAQPYVTE